MRISNKKLFIDLKLFSSACHSLALNYEEMVNEFWKNDIFSDYGLLACIRIPTVRRALFRQLQNQKLFVLGSVFKHGLCSAYLQRKPARYTSVLARGKTKDLSHGHSGKDFPQYTDASTPTLLRRSSRKPDSFMQTIHLASSWNKPSTRWILPPSIFAYLCSRGRYSANARER